MKFLKNLTMAFALIAMLIMVGCSSGGGSSTTLVRGVVKDSATSKALPGVTVSAGSVTSTTDINGQFSLAVAPGSNIKIKAIKAGYVDVIDVCGVTNGGTAEVDFSLKAVGFETTFSGMIANDKTALDPRGTEVKLTAGTILDKDTSVAVDSAKIEITTGIANDANYVDNFPGLFIGNKNGIDNAIESFGFITVDITSGGKDCKLATGTTAAIAIPVGTGAADPGTATIELWSLNEDTGKWVYEGMATRDATFATVYYRANVSHFSTYNLDRPIQSAMPLTVTVKNGDAVVSGASIVAKTSTAPMWEGRGTTGADGKYRFDSVPPGTNNIIATFGNLKGIAYAYDIVGGEGFLTISLQQYVSKTMSFYYMDGTTKVKAAGANVNIFSEGNGGMGQSSFNGLTDADGKITAFLSSSAGFFNLNASLTVGATNYYVTKNYSKFADIPAEVEILKQ
ncbi:MAG: carboxypeptidase regulatory-like domain-containing protein [bacterium]